MSNPEKRISIRSGAPWEPIVGYSRAVRIGNTIAVAGSAPVGAGGDVVAVGDAYQQTRRCIEVIEEALQAAGAGLKDVIRTRMFVTNIEQWPEIGRAHQEAFGEVPPATSMVEVSRLIDPDMWIEIEADAVIADN